MNQPTNAATLHPEVRLYLSRTGQAGGLAGKGESKRRGDSNYYRSIVAKRKDRQAALACNVAQVEETKIPS